MKKMDMDGKAGFTMLKVLARISALLFLVWAAFFAFFTVGLNDELYTFAQQRAGVTSESCALTTQQRMQMNMQITAYLGGAGDVPEDLSSRAQAHMADVKTLLNTLRIVMHVSLAGALLAFVLGGRKHFKLILRTYWKGAAVAAAAFVLGAALLWTRFEQVFRVFHEWTFSNTNWLLNPEEDALIRIMPTAFFQEMALFTLIFIVIGWLLGGAMLGAAKTLAERKWET